MRVAVVSAVGERQSRSLLAHVVLAPDAAADAEALRGFLRAKLPAYMVPAGFILVSEIPLTANGKVDRSALAAGQKTIAAGRAPVPPRTPVEELVANAYAEVLGVDRPGVDDDFFELGGNSILATRVASRLRTALRTDVPLRVLFEAPTGRRPCRRARCATRQWAGRSTADPRPAQR